MGTKLRALGAKHHKVGTKRLCNGGKAPLNGDKVLRVAQCNVALPIPLQVPCPSPPGHPNSSGCPPWAPPAQPSPKTRHILPKPRDKVAGWERQQQVSPVSLLPRVLAPAQSLAPRSPCQASSWHMLCLAKWLTASGGNPVRVPFRGFIPGEKTSGQAARVQLWPIPVSPQLGAELGWWHWRRPRSAPKPAGVPMGPAPCCLPGAGGCSEPHSRAAVTPRDPLGTWVSPSVGEIPPDLGESKRGRSRHFSTCSPAHR